MWDYALDGAGFAFVPGAVVRARLGPLTDWAAFAASWGDLPVDAHMADAGRYRRRRHATFRLADGQFVRQPHRPHFQAKAYNVLNGGVERWFEPIQPEIADGATFQAALKLARDTFAKRAPQVAAWDVEVHQFRIEAKPGAPGKPTPEGVHRDGVDWVLVLLVNRTNIKSGETTVHGPDGKLLGSFTLAEPLDAALVDDHRVFHGVTAVQPVDPHKPAFRDVLVVTFRSEAAPR